MTVADSAQAEALTRNIPEASSWTADGYAALLSSGGGFGFVAQQESGEGNHPQQMIGFVLGRIISDEAEILNLAVKQAARRQGTGSALAAEAIKLISGKGARRVFLEVRESNQTARSFYRKMGFEAVGRRKAYYHEPAEDAIILQKSVPISA